MLSYKEDSIIMVEKNMNISHLTVIRKYLCYKCVYYEYYHVIIIHNIIIIIIIVKYCRYFNIIVIELFELLPKIN